MGAARARVRVIHRPGKLGLGTAVLEGFALAQTEIVGVMDGDLSHPPELRADAVSNDRATAASTLVVASRYVPGGGTSNFPLGRWLLSRAGCWLARPLTPVRDAMSGFFLIRRDSAETFRTSVRGFKIGLELFVRSQPRQLAEVGYVVRRPRSPGESKMSLAEGNRVPAAARSLYRDWLVPRRSRRPALRHDPRWSGTRPRRRRCRAPDARSAVPHRAAPEQRDRRRRPAAVLKP